MASGLGLYNPAMRTLAFMNIREWNFRDPVHIGDTIHVHTKVLEIEPRAKDAAASLPGRNSFSIKPAAWCKKASWSPWLKAAPPSSERVRSPINPLPPANADVREPPYHSC